MNNHCFWEFHIISMIFFSIAQNIVYDIIPPIRRIEMIDTILFDLDGTLLKMNEKQFIQSYFSRIQALFEHLELDVPLVMKGFLQGVTAMISNNGTKTNEEAYWDTFTAITKIDRNLLEPHLQTFYETTFNEVIEATDTYENLQAVLDHLINKGYTLLLTTNPMFPRIATMSRIRWANLNPESFKEITTFENYHYCKPNPHYYREVLEKMGIEPNKCLMVGNDAQEDLVVQKLGMTTYLVTDHLIDRENNSYKTDYESTMVEFIEFAYNQLPDLKP